MTPTETLLLAGITTLGGVIAYLFRQVQTDMNTMKKDIEACEADRLKLWERLFEQAKYTCNRPNCAERQVTQLNALGPKVS